MRCFVVADSRASIGWIDPTGVPIRRYERERPGELVHLDVKKLGRIPGGGGTGSTAIGPNAGRNIGHDYIHVAVDDHSRLAYVEVLPDERGATAAGFVLRDGRAPRRARDRDRAGHDRQRQVLRESRAFHAALDDLGAAHRRTRSYRPQTNGKAERFIQTLLKEWAYDRAYPNNAAGSVAPTIVQNYNHRRPHTALGGLPPISRVSTT